VGTSEDKKLCDGKDDKPRDYGDRRQNGETQQSRHGRTAQDEYAENDNPPLQSHVRDK
jgi:hypothetical protein